MSVNFSIANRIAAIKTKNNPNSEIIKKLLSYMNKNYDPISDDLTYDDLLKEERDYVLILMKPFISNSFNDIKNFEKEVEDKNIEFLYDSVLSKTLEDYDFMFCNEELVKSRARIPFNTHIYTFNLHEMIYNPEWMNKLRDYMINNYELNTDYFEEISNHSRLSFYWDDIKDFFKDDEERRLSEDLRISFIDIKCEEDVVIQLSQNKFDFHCSYLEKHSKTIRSERLKTIFNPVAKFNLDMFKNTSKTQGKELFEILKTGFDNFDSTGFFTNLCTQNKTLFIFFNNIKGRFIDEEINYLKDNNFLKVYYNYTKEFLDKINLENDFVFTSGNKSEKYEDIIISISSKDLYHNYQDLFSKICNLNKQLLPNELKKLGIKPSSRLLYYKFGDLQIILKDSEINTLFSENLASIVYKDKLGDKSMHNFNHPFTDNEITNELNKIAKNDIIEMEGSIFKLTPENGEVVFNPIANTLKVDNFNCFNSENEEILKLKTMVETYKKAFISLLNNKSEKVEKKFDWTQNLLKVKDL